MRPLRILLSGWLIAAMLGIVSCSDSPIIVYTPPDRQPDRQPCDHKPCHCGRYPRDPYDDILVSAPRFDQQHLSREARDGLGWYMYTRADADTGRLVEIIIASDWPASVDMTPSQEEVIFADRHRGRYTFGGNTGSLGLIDKRYDGTLRLSLTSLRGVSADPVLAYFRAVQREPQLTIRQFIMTSSTFTATSPVREFFALHTYSKQR